MVIIMMHNSRAGLTVKPLRAAAAGQWPAWHSQAGDIRFKAAAAVRHPPHIYEQHLKEEQGGSTMSAATTASGPRQKSAIMILPASGGRLLWLLQHEAL
jgi:hypothetical protein